jgi:hypothetical protein
MNELNLHNRLPKDLPDKETIKDILLELEDTNEFDIKLINLQSTRVDGGKWYANSRYFSEWVEQGEVVVNEIDYPSFNYRLHQDEEFFTPSFASVKETRYNIIRYPMRISVKLKGVIPKELIDTSNEVYLRLKDYLGPDVIQDQYDQKMGFMIDFMMSKVRLSTEICS